MHGLKSHGLSTFAPMSSHYIDTSLWTKDPPVNFNYLVVKCELLLLSTWVKEFRNNQ
jgi:hypothetical protein